MTTATAAAAAPATLALHLSSLPWTTAAANPNNRTLLISGRRRSALLGTVCCGHGPISRRSGSGGGGGSIRGAEFDPELRLVLELATDSELYELERILFGPSYFSPLLKSVTGKVDIDFATIGQDLEERQDFIAALESRFLFLAADARSTLRGWKPSYRNVLLAVRKKLNIPCSSKLSTEDLEAEIFLHLVEDYARYLSIFHDWNCDFKVAQFASPDVTSLIEESGTFPWLWELSNASTYQGTLGPCEEEAPVARKLGLAELWSMILKGSGMFTLAKIYQLLGRKLTGKVFLEAANYQIKKEVIKKGGQLAAINLESRVALLAAKQGLSGAASRYLGFRSVMTFLGPVLWGTFLADMVIQMLGTDYARILRAIFAFAQIRITRTYRVTSTND